MYMGLLAGSFQQQWLNSACCMARPAKANPRSRPIRAGDKSLFCFFFVPMEVYYW
jgi:hypothetical protein